MSSHPPAILYLNTDPGARIPGMTLAGIRRDASARGWTAEAFSSEESRPDSIRKLLVSRAPVAGCVYECSDDNIPSSPDIFGAVPVVYLHASPSPRKERIVRVPTDNAAVARAAFRELSEGRPPAVAVVGLDIDVEWSATRERVFRALAAKAGIPCRTFQRLDEDAATRAERLAAWVAGLPRHCAVFAVNDLMAAEVVAAAGAARRAIPRELTLLGVDNLSAICEATKPTISSIQIDFERAGYIAARIIGERIGTTATSGTNATRKVGRPCRPRCPGSLSIAPLLVVRRESTRGWGRREPFVLDAIERIRREACEGLTAAALAADFPGSRWLFELRFREAMGHSVLDEIQHVRLEKVCLLLAQTRTAIGALAALCGYRTDIALKRIFRKRFGMSMMEWRRRHGR